MSVKDWSFGRKLAVVVGFILVVDLIAGIILIKQASTPGSPVNSLAQSLQRSAARGAGGSYLSESHQRRVVSDCNDILKSDPDNKKALEDRAEAYFGLEQTNLAAADYEHLSRLEPKEPIWVKYRARCLETYDQDAAIEAYTRLIAMEGGKLESLMARAQCYLRQDKKDLALKDLDATQKMSLDAEQLYDRALIYFRADNMPRYTADLSRAVDTTSSVASDRRAALVPLCHYYIQHEEYDRALQWQRHFIEDLTQMAKTEKETDPLSTNQVIYADYQRLGEMLLASGDKVAARDAYKKAQELVVKRNSVPFASGSAEEKYYTDFAHLINQIEIAQVLKEPEALHQAQEQAVSKARVELDDPEKTWYGNLVNLVGALDGQNRVIIGEAALRSFERNQMHRKAQNLHQLRVLILLNRKDEAANMIAALPATPHGYRMADIYLDLGMKEKALSSVSNVDIKSTKTDEPLLIKLKVQLACNDLAGACQTYAALDKRALSHGDGYLILSHYATARGDKALASRYKKIAVAMGDHDALMDICDGKL